MTGRAWLSLELSLLRFFHGMILTMPKDLFESARFEAFLFNPWRLLIGLRFAF